MKHLITLLLVLLGLSALAQFVPGGSPVFGSGTGGGAASGVIVTNQFDGSNIVSGTIDVARIRGVSDNATNASGATIATTADRVAGLIAGSRNTNTVTVQATNYFGAAPTVQQPFWQYQAGAPDWNFIYQDPFGNPLVNIFYKTAGGLIHYYGGLTNEAFAFQVSATPHDSAEPRQVFNFLDDLGEVQQQYALLTNNFDYSGLGGRTRIFTVFDNGNWSIGTNARTLSIYSGGFTNAVGTNSLIVSSNASYFKNSVYIGDSTTGEKGLFFWDAINEVFQELSYSVSDDALVSTAPIIAGGFTASLGGFSGSGANLTGIPASGLAKIAGGTNAVAWFNSTGVLTATNTTGSGAVVLSNSPTIYNFLGIGTNAGCQLELYSAGNVTGAGGWMSLSNRFKRYIYQASNGGDIVIGTSLNATDGYLTLETAALTTVQRKNGAENMTFASGSISFSAQLRQTNGFVLASNTLATWPATPPSPGSVYWANSNGVLYVLYSTNGSGGGSASWTKTNYFGP